MTRSPALCLHQKTSSSSKRMRSSGGVEEKFGCYSPTPNKTEHAPYPLWSELSHGHMTGWIGFCVEKYPISALWQKRPVLMNATSAGLSPWPSWRPTSQKQSLRGDRSLVFRWRSASSRYRLRGHYNERPWRQTQSRITQTTSLLPKAASWARVSAP